MTHLPPRCYIEVIDEHKEPREVPMSFYTQQATVAIRDMDHTLSNSIHYAILGHPNRGPTNGVHAAYYKQRTMCFKLATNNAPVAHVLSQCVQDLGIFFNALQQHLEPQLSIAPS